MTTKEAVGFMKEETNKWTGEHPTSRLQHKQHRSNRQLRELCGFAPFKACLGGKHTKRRESLNRLQ